MSAAQRHRTHRMKCDYPCTIVNTMAEGPDWTLELRLEVACAGCVTQMTQTTMHGTTNRRHLHKVALEEFLQLLLLCRVGQVADVESPALGGAREDGSIGLVVGLGNAGIGQSVGNVIDGGVGGLLHVGSRHFDGCWGWLDGSRLVKSESEMTSKLVNLFLVQKKDPSFGELKA